MRWYACTEGVGYRACTVTEQMSGDSDVSQELLLEVSAGKYEYFRFGRDVSMTLCITA